MSEGIKSIIVGQVRIRCFGQFRRAHGPDPDMVPATKKNRNLYYKKNLYENKKVKS